MKRMELFVKIITGATSLTLALFQVASVITGFTSFYSWYWPFIGVAAMLAISLVCYAMKPPTKRHPEWLYWRAVIPVALMGLGNLTGIASQIAIELGIATAMDSFLLRMAEPAMLALATTAIAVFGGLSTLEIILRGIVNLLKRELGEHEEEKPSIFEEVFDYFDELWLAPVYAWLPASETLEMVYSPSKALVADQVGEAIPTGIRRSMSTTALFIVTGGIVTLAATVIPPFVEFTNGNFDAVIRFPWPLAMFFIFITPIAGIVPMSVTILGRYLIAEWNRRHDRVVSFRDTLFRAWIKAPGGTPYKSASLTAKLTAEAKMGAAGELSPESEAQTLGGKVWDGMFLWSGRGFELLWNFLGIEPWEPDWERVAMGFYPTAKEGGGDTISHVDFQDTTQACHVQIGEMSRFWSATEGKGVGEGIGKRLLDTEAAEVPVVLDQPDVYQQVDQLRRLFFQRLAEMTGHEEAELLEAYGSGGRLIDLMDPNLEDPGRWDRRTGRPLWEPRV